MDSPEPGARGIPWPRIRRMVVKSVWALWLGGATFYSGVVIPTAHHVLGSHRPVGFVTQEVTRWINVIGLVALLLAVSQVRARAVGLAWRRGWWFASLAILAALVALHPVLDGALDPATRRITGRGTFDAWHHVYMWLSTAGLVAGIGFAWCWQDDHEALGDA